MVVGVGVLPRRRSVRRELPQLCGHFFGIREYEILERRGVRYGGVWGGDPPHGCIKIFKRLRRDKGRYLGPHPPGERGLVDHHELSGLPDRRENRLPVQWNK